MHRNNRMARCRNSRAVMVECRKMSLLGRTHPRTFYLKVVFNRCQTFQTPRTNMIAIKVAGVWAKETKLATTVKSSCSTQSRWIARQITHQRWEVRIQQLDLITSAWLQTQTTTWRFKIAKSSQRGQLMRFHKVWCQQQELTTTRQLVTHGLAVESLIPSAVTHWVATKSNLWIWVTTEATLVRFRETHHSMKTTL